jgi:DNA-binding transcriptional ArsR family regulator
MAGTEDGSRSHDREDHYRRAAVLHPLRQRILRLMSDGREAGLAGIAADLKEPRGTVAYHLSVLVARGALGIVPRQKAAPVLYRWSSDAEWARKMLDEIDARSAEDD